MGNRDKIKRLSKLVRGLVLAIGCIWLGSTLWLAVQFVLSPDFIDKRLVEGTFFSGQPIALSLYSRWALGFAYAVSAIISGSMFYAIWRFFGALISDGVVSGTAGVWARRAGLAVLASAVYSILLTTLKTLVLSINDGADSIVLVFGFQKEEGMALIAAGTLIVVGQVLVLTAAVDEENRSFV